MKKVITKYINAKTMCMLMALHILNFSIDNPHTLFENSKVDKKFEEVDSIVELVLEDVLCIENAIPENHSKSPLTNKFNAKKMVWLFEERQYTIPQAPACENYRIVFAHNFYRNPIYSSPLVSIFSPPPEA